MKERSIRMSGEMVRALLAGTKTQTRWIVKPQPINQPFWSGGFAQWIESRREIDGTMWKVNCPYGMCGDWLWVRESWRTDRSYDHIAPCNLSQCLPIFYGADIMSGYHKLRSSTHMPRWASRITLEITGVRCERVQEISPQDVVAEGFPFHSDRDAYASLWDKTNGRGSWEANPWVWVVEYKRLEQS